VRQREWNFGPESDQEVRRRIHEPAPTAPAISTAAQVDGSGTCVGDCEAIHAWLAETRLTTKEAGMSKDWSVVIRLPLEL
jgi:hypothetical protein